MSQCQYQIKAGRQCSRKVKGEAKYCYQHIGQIDDDDSSIHLSPLPISEPTDVKPTSLKVTVNHQTISVPLSDDNLWVDVWIPQTQSQLIEAPIQQKIGGEEPLFRLGQDQQWPMIDGQPSVFVAQFLDPRPEHPDNFIRIFIKIWQEINGDGQPDGLLQQFKLQGERPIKLTHPYVMEEYSHPLLIVGWLHRYELDTEELSKQLYNARTIEDPDLAMDQVTQQLDTLGYGSSTWVSKWAASATLVKALPIEN